jgi:hypothetical protein
LNALRILLALASLALLPFPAGTSELTDKETKTARKLYLSKCAKCHKFYPPSDYSDADWHQWMQKMGKKAKLKPEQYDLLSRYLETFRVPVK